MPDPLIFGMDKEAARAGGQADPYDPLVSIGGRAPGPPQPNPLQGAIDVVAAPGRLMQAPQPTLGQMWSDEDEALRQLNAAGEAWWAAEMGLGMVGTPGGAGGLGSGIRAFHGSPHDFVFDDKLIDSIKKYGLAGLIAGGVSNFTPTTKAQAAQKAIFPVGDYTVREAPTGGYLLYRTTGQPLDLNVHEPISIHSTRDEAIEAAKRGQQ